MGCILSDKTAVVTGGASGIGRAISLCFAKEGADIVIADIREKPKGGGEPTHEIISNDCNANGRYVECDVTNPSDLDTAVEVAEQYGGIDIMVNNAGFGRTESFIEVTESEYDQMMDVNAKSVFFGSQAAVKRMQQRDGGSIINMSSSSGIRGSYNSVTYSASKGAVRLMTYAIAGQFGPDGIRVNAIHPGTVDTGLQVETYGDKIDKKERYNEVAVPLGRTGNPEEIANVALFLASDAASYVTGQSLVADGGITNTKTDPRELF